MQSDLRSLRGWVRGLDRLVSGPAGWKAFDWEIERQWALAFQRAAFAKPAEINAYLKALRDGALTKHLKRVRAIFIGHGEVGKTSLIESCMART